MGYPDWTFPIVFVLQEGELWPILEWVSRQGQEKHWQRYAPVNAGESDTWEMYTVGTGKKLYIVRAIISGQFNAVWELYSTAPTIYAYRTLLGPWSALVVPFVPPFTVEAGDSLVYKVLNQHATDAGLFTATISGYELPV